VTWLTALHTAHRSNWILGEHLQIFGARRGVCAKVAFAIQNQQYLWNKAAYIQSYCKVVYRISIGDKSADLGWTLVYCSGGAKFFHNGYLAYTLCQSATKFGSFRGLAIETCFPNFVNFGPWVPWLPFGDLHQHLPYVCLTELTIIL